MQTLKLRAGHISAVSQGNGETLVIVNPTDATRKVLLYLDCGAVFDCVELEDETSGVHVRNHTGRFVLLDKMAVAYDTDNIKCVSHLHLAKLTY